MTVICGLLPSVVKVLQRLLCFGFLFIDSNPKPLWYQISGFAVLCSADNKYSRQLSVLSLASTTRMALTAFYNRVSTNLRMCHGYGTIRTLGQHHFLAFQGCGSTLVGQQWQGPCSTA